MSERTTIDVILVEPMKPPKMVTIEGSLESMQKTVGGSIEEYMPFIDEVAIVCNEEGKLRGMDLNRAIYDERGRMMDIIAGPFFLAYAPIESENFLSMPENLKEKYMKKFKLPELFVQTERGIQAIPMAPHRPDFVR